MVKSVRQSTTGVYQAKWGIFADWCHQRRIDPVSATIPQVADFFIYLRDDKKLTVPTIKGYRSALTLALRASGVDIANSREISALIRSFAGECPVRSPKLPKWDLSLVLASLNRSPYEPLDTADFKFVTHKCVFLLALASAKRVSELQALSSVVLHREDWSSVSFDFAEDFLAKTDIPLVVRQQTRAFSVPALSGFASDSEDCKLCPVRALRCYLSRSKGRRGQGSRLFVPILGERTFVSKNTIAAWIKSVIRSAYAFGSRDLQSTYKVSAHEVCALATSVHFNHNQSLSAVMAAASWRAHSTFSSFYLRDLSLVAGDVYSLGPIVAAQTVITAPTTASSSSFSGPATSHVRSTARHDTSTRTAASRSCTISTRSTISVASTGGGYLA